MKLNELKKIEEGIVSSIKGMFTGQGGYQTQVQDIFIKDFVQDALTSLNNGVKGGLINPDTKAAAPAGLSGTATQQGLGAQEPLKATTTNVKFSGPGAPGAANAAPATGQAAAPATGQANTQTTQYMGKVAPNAGPATKPAAPASPFSTPTLNQPKTTVSTTLNKNSKPGAITTGGAGMTVKESSYDKMNRIFESIINIDEETQARTVADFMMDWFSQYMQGVNWQSSQAIVKDKLEKLQKEYPANVKQNLTDLARIGLALSKTGTPAGAPPEFSQAKKSMGSSITDLKTELDGLAKSNPQAYNELLKSLRPANVNPAG